MSVWNLFQCFWSFDVQYAVVRCCVSTCISTGVFPHCSHFATNNRAIHSCFAWLCRYLSHRDSITVSVWNYKKIHKKHGAGFLGCIRILSNNIQRLKDTGCTLFDCTATLFWICGCLLLQVVILMVQCLLCPCHEGGGIKWSLLSIHLSVCPMPLAEKQCFRAGVTVDH